MEDSEMETLDVFLYAPIPVLLALFAVFLVVIAVSNVFVLAVLISCKKMRTSTNTYIMSVCFACLLVGVFTCASSLHEITGGIGSSSPAVCTAFVYLEILAIAACVFSFVATAVDRYRTIVQFNKPRFSMKTTYLILLVVWTISIVYGAKSFLQASELAESHDDDDDDDDDTERRDKNSSVLAEERICSNFLEDESGDFIFRVIDLALLVVIPLAMMTILYSLIVHKLWSSKVTNNSIQSNRKTLRLLIIIVGTFFVSWSPFHVFEVIHDSLESRGVELDRAVYGGIRVWTLVLAISNCWTSPVIYCYMNRNFRTEVKRLLRSLRVRRAVVAPEREIDGGQTGSSGFT